MSYSKACLRRAQNLCQVKKRNDNFSLLRRKLHESATTIHNPIAGWGPHPPPQKKKKKKHVKSMIPVRKNDYSGFPMNLKEK